MIYIFLSSIQDLISFVWKGVHVPEVPSGGVAHVPVDVLDDVIDGAAEALVTRRLIRLEKGS